MFKRPAVWKAGTKPRFARFKVAGKPIAPSLFWRRLASSFETIEPQAASVRLAGEHGCGRKEGKVLYSRARPEVIAIVGIILVVAALWGAWAFKTPDLFWL